MHENVRITSVKNPIVQRFRAAAAGEDPTAMVVDGIRLVEEALDSGCRLREIATSPRLVSSERGRALRRRLAPLEVVEDCSDDVLTRISNLVTHQGVAAIVERPQWRAEDLLAYPALLVIAAGVRDPGNLGALVRTAEAAGATGLVTLAGSADPFRDKAVRGSAGSVLRLPVLPGLAPPDLRALLARAEAAVVIAEADAEREYLEVDMRSPVALVIGNEGAGVPEWLADIPARRVCVPMRAPVESLNAAAAAAVLLFEARRQRG